MLVKRNPRFLQASGTVQNKVGGGRSSPESGASESGSGSEERLMPPKNSGKQNGLNASIRSNSSGSGVVERFEYSGWVYHLGVNNIGHEYCHFRFLSIRGKHLEMYERDPHENPGTKPILRGVIGHTLMVEELGRRKLNHSDMYVLRFYNRLDEAKKGEIACATAGDAQKWMEAFDHAKQLVEYELSKAGSVRNKLNMEEINLESHRPRVRHYAHGLKKLIRIGQGPEMLVRRASSVGGNTVDTFYDADSGDTVEAHEWRCVRTVNGVRIFEDAASSMSEGSVVTEYYNFSNILVYRMGKGILVKAVGVVDASADNVFEILLSPDRHRRYEWDTFTGDLELVDSIDGHYDVLYGTFDPRYLTWWQTKRDFVFSRQWFRGQDGTYNLPQYKEPFDWNTRMNIAAGALSSKRSGKARAPAGVAVVMPVLYGGGMHNEHNTCYVNVILQCLLHTGPFFEAFINNEHNLKCRCDHGFCLPCSIEQLCYEAISGPCVFDPEKITGNLSYFSESFELEKPQHEDVFLHHLFMRLQQLHKDEVCEPDLITRIFGWPMITRFVCPHCECIAAEDEVRSSLYFEILLEEEADFEEAILKGFGHHGKSFKRDLIDLSRDDPPNVAIFVIKRRYEQIPLRFFESLDMGIFAADRQELRYSLYAMVVYIRVEPDLNAEIPPVFGHVYCVCLCDKHWIKFDDGEVTSMEKEEVFGLNPCMLFYRSKDTSLFMDSLRNLKLAGRTTKFDESSLEEGWEF